MSTLAINLIRIDGGTQPRERIDQSVVEDYAEQIKGGAAFPPADVFFDGVDYWLADGFHRRAGYLLAGRAEMPAELRQGTQRDAILFSVGANAQHGHRRTNADKRRAVQRLLGDAEWSKWSDREIAKRCGVHHQMVATMRPATSLDESSSERSYTTRHGTTATMNTAKIGRAKERKQSTPSPAPANRLAAPAAEPAPVVPVTNEAGETAVEKPVSIAPPTFGELGLDNAEPAVIRKAMDDIDPLLAEHRRLAAANASDPQTIARLLQKMDRMLSSSSPSLHELRALFASLRQSVERALCTGK